MRSLRSLRHRRVRARLAIQAAVAIAAIGACHAPSPSVAVVGASATSVSAVDELLAADRQYSAASAGTDMVTGLSAMFSSDVALFAPGRPVSANLIEAVAALRSDSTNLSSRAEWVPIRGGISGDGTQGFTAGYLTSHRADGTTVSQKYLSYWRKEPRGWRVLVYKRGRRPAGSGAMPSLPPVLPTSVGHATSDPAIIDDFRRSLESAERGFSDDAQVVGLAAAFARHGSADAMNMGGAAQAAFVVGATEIGQVVGVDEPATGSSVRWSADRVIVASSGDLGITIGTIRGNDPAGNLAVPFCTVWHRRTTTEGWKYIAE